jgi:hypothetical protein
MHTRGGIFIRNPRLVFADADGDGSGGGSDSQAASQQQAPAFPANTPVAEMSVEQQAAYWKHQSRQHEGRVKAFGDLTPDAAREALAERDRLKNEKLTADERAVEAAKAEGATPWKTALAYERVNNALERALAGRVPDTAALLELDRSTFVNADTATANTEAIAAWVAAHSTEPAQQKKNPPLGQGRERGTDGPSKGSKAGRDLFADRHPNKQAS